MSIEVGEIIKKERKSKNISKGDLAKMVGCTTRVINYREKGTRSISLGNANKIFKALEITLTIGNIEQ